MSFRLLGVAVSRLRKREELKLCNKAYHVARHNSNRFQELLSQLKIERGYCEHRVVLG